MIALAFALFVQDPAAAEVNKLLAGLENLFLDAVKHSDELDRRYVALAKVLEANREGKWRDAALSWMPKLARKTGRPAEALAAAQELLKSPGLDPGRVEGAYLDAIYSAALALKPDEIVSLVGALAKDRPG